jgi:hypothetical protein
MLSPPGRLRPGSARRVCLGFSPTGRPRYVRSIGQDVRGVEPVVATLAEDIGVGTGWIGKGFITPGFRASRDLTVPLELFCHSQWAFSLRTPLNLVVSFF